MGLRHSWEKTGAFFRSPCFRHVKLPPETTLPSREEAPHHQTDIRGLFYTSNIKGLCGGWWRGQRFRGCNRTSNIGYVVMCRVVTSLMFRWCLTGCNHPYTLSRPPIDPLSIGGGGGAASCGLLPYITCFTRILNVMGGGDGWYIKTSVCWIVLERPIDSSHFTFRQMHFTSNDAICLSRLTSIFCEWFRRVERKRL